MQTYEIVNPSDQYTLQAERFEVACVTTLLLGDGKYGLRSTSDNMPILLFGNHEEWVKRRFDCSVDELIASVSLDELATCLETVLIGDRDVFELAIRRMTLESQAEFKIEWHDKNRSSLNDIGRRAWDYAKSLREAGKNNENS